MRGLLLRLSTLDADAASAVRVIAYFDALIQHRAPAKAVVQATARLAQCPAGLAGTAGTALRAAPGAPAEPVDGPPAGAGTAAFGTGVVWLERRGDAHPLDEIVLERFAVTAEVALERAAGPAIDDPALVELVLSSEVGEAERARALRLLGFRADQPMRVLATPAEEPGAEAAAKALRALGGHARWAGVGGTAAVLVAPGDRPPPEALAVPHRLGIGPAVPPAQVIRSWEAARTALRFARDHAAVAWEDLGGLALLAEHVPVAAITALPDVQALDRLVARPYGARTLEAIEALCDEGSMRRAAAAVHLHHSTLATRIEKAEAALGFSLAAPEGRLRARLALTLFHLRSDETR